ncbi:MAG: polyhydroxyalkanoate synthesis repressor PhaR [Rhodospirillaceae bacterium]|nr:MAG: polyhydroxyalkanoate synthesis repressor PhaR [Rhodospirillaceae bacterium]
MTRHQEKRLANPPLTQSYIISYYVSHVSRNALIHAQVPKQHLACASKLFYNQSPDRSTSLEAWKPAMVMEKNRSGLGLVMIKKYANRRLYNTATSSYVTLDHLCRMVKDGTNFMVHDAKTGEDITRSVLTQIIVEEEAKGQNLLPISFLRQLISFYGDSLGGLVPRYLEYSMHAFAQHEEQMRSLMQNALDGLFPFNQFEEMGKQNMDFFEGAMKMFIPFYGDQLMYKSEEKK